MRALAKKAVGGVRMVISYRARLRPVPVPNWPSGINVPTVGLFRDITVMPPARPYVHNMLHGEFGMCCGPIWPDFDSQSFARHNIWGHAVDRLPPTPTAAPRRLDRSCVWLGYLHFQFGHLVAEHLSRALWSRYLRPDDLFLFAVAPGESLASGGPVLRDLFSWYGFRRDQLMQVTEPIIVPELWVVPQAEQLTQIAPYPEYLDLLDFHLAQCKIPRLTTSLLYVTRDGMLRHRTGSNAGEGYLRRILSAQGVAILDPARASIQQQIASYAGARQIVFAEGSAMHGRQLLGRLDQRVIVLNRRLGSRTAEAMLRPRVTELDYVEATRCAAIPVASWGEPMSADGLGFYDLAVVFDAFERLGVDIAKDWDAIAYRDAVNEDVVLWRDCMLGSSRGYEPAGLEAILGSALDEAMLTG